MTDQTADALKIRYRPSPTLHRMHKSKARVRGIMGPIGCGKTVGCVMECWRIAMEQAPDGHGVRRTRIAVIRNTFAQLKSTTIKTWQEWIPDEVCGIVYDSPIRGLMELGHPDGKTTVHCEIMFIALDKPTDIKRLLSLELTAAYINEARELPWSIILAVRSRLGRYPAKSTAPLTQAALIMDTNPPDVDHWWYLLSELKRAPLTEEDAAPLDVADFEFFTQPPALLQTKAGGYLPNPNAENVEHQQLGYRYWLDQIPGASKEWIKVYLLGRYGFVMDGRPVYPEYQDDLHYTENVDCSTSLKLLIAFDFGLTPACIIGQVTARGQFRALEELVSDRMGIEQFVTAVVKPHLAVNYSYWKIGEILATGDPAGEDPVQTDARTCFDVLLAAGFRMQSLPTNAFIPRREAVAGFLTRVDMGTPSFLMSSKCPVLRKGFQGGYHLRRMAIPGKEIYRDEPDKDRFSHPHDALQYICLLARGAGVTKEIVVDEEGRDSQPNRRDRRLAGGMLA